MSAPAPEPGSAEPPAVPSVSLAPPFGLTDVKPHQCRLPTDWPDILNGHGDRAAPKRDPGEFLDEPDRLPDDWREPYIYGHNSYYVTPWSTRRLARDLTHGVDLLSDALRTAGWSLAESRELLRTVDILGKVDRLGAEAWNFRRFGFGAEETARWSEQVPDPAIARLYADIGYKPELARRLIDWARDQFEREHRPGAQAAVLCFKVSRRRARHYEAAGIGHAEIHYWERHRYRLEPDARAELDETLAVMAALNSGRG